MPNWSECILTIEGPKEVTEDFLRFAAGEGAFDFIEVQVSRLSL